nr:hypothetical protein [uncultured Oscillibacter sp.]
MTCGRDKAVKLLAELDTKKGVGLIERIKQGQGKPTKIYVKRFTTRTVPADLAPPLPEPFAPISEVAFSNVQKPEIPTPRGGKIDFQKSKKLTLIILRETRRSLFRLIHPSPHESPRRRDWR